MRIQAKLNELIPGTIVELSAFSNATNILEKEVIVEDKGLYNKLSSIVTYYALGSSDKNCCKRYQEFSGLVPELNNLLKQYRVGLMRASFGGDNPHMQQAFLLEKI